MARVDPADLTVWTIGHSTRPFDAFLGLLADQRIELLADVRTHPGSRTFPQYGHDALADALPRAGVGYEHFPGLGGRRRAPADAPPTVWRNASFHGYATYARTDAFADALDGLLAAAARQRTAMMCSEAVWWRCHRALIADRLKSMGVRVLHIMGPGPQAVRIQEHPYTSAARLDGGRLTYAPPEGD